MDIAARVGGNTFLIYLREIASEEITMMYCRMLSVALKQCYQGLEYTISIGASVFPQNGATYEELFTHASEALHTSKHNGKNCFTL